MAFILPISPVLAATAKDPVKLAPSANEAAPVDALLLAVQSLLAEMGLYHGPLDGRMSSATADAIRLHQKAWNLKQTALPSEDLLQHLEMVAGMRRIERRLKLTRTEQISGARRLIEESTATRRLLMSAASRPPTAVDDPKRCFLAPAPECLTVLARQSALASPAGAMRDWALSEVASEAAESGVHLLAWEVASRIEDPRTLISALEAVARSLSDGGHFQAALETLEALPDPARRCEAALVLALRQAESGNGNGARSARRVALAILDKLRQPEEVMGARLKLSEISLRLGETEQALSWKADAEKRLSSLPADSRQGAMANLSIIESGLGRFDASRQWLVQVHDGLLRVPGELKLVDAMILAGRGREAQAMVKEIDQPRYRALALVRLAAAAAEMGQSEDAERQLREADVLVQSIDLPFAKSYGQSQIALVWQKLGKEELAAAIVRTIEDEAVRAQTFWRLSDKAAAKDRDKFIQEAQAATQTYGDPFGRVWMFVELSKERLRQGDGKGASAYVARGMLVAENIKDSWSRARALAAMAGAYSALRKH